MKWLVVLIGLSVSSDVRMGERNWDRDAEAIQNVVLQRDRRDVAKFLVARGNKPTTLACLPYLEVRPALRNLPVRVVGVPFEPSSDVQSSLDALSKLGATHIAFESNIAEFSETRDWTEAIASLVDQAPHRFRLARATRYVLIYEILPPLPEALSPAGS